jgi:hypothetical protein
MSFGIVSAETYVSQENHDGPNRRDLDTRGRIRPVDVFAGVGWRGISGTTRSKAVEVVVLAFLQQDALEW